MPVTALARKSPNPTAAILTSAASAQSPSAVAQPVGRLHLGRRVDNRPESLAAWRVTTSQLPVAVAVADHFELAHPRTAAATDGEIEVMTRTPTMRIITNAEAITTDMRLWGQGRLVHHCNGSTFLSPPTAAGSPCGCPRSMADRRALAKAGRGPHPSVTVDFRLAQLPGLGMFRFQSASWKFAESLPAVRAALDATGGEALCELAIQRVDVPIGGGSHLAYRMPVLTVLGPWG
ncbi:hypothetical protein ACGF12_35995 [Kitasatospora sp. NPDC048296]|uniref:recombination directionality factor n=1 Tax=Kitasatospora sp. NPDC048296 TaxID=3364048 RepID=UPI003712057F